MLDASGTWTGPNPLGGDGLPAVGETYAAARITYRVPDFSDAAVAARYRGKHVVVAGTGASAKTALIGLVRLAEDDHRTRVSWLVRRPSVGQSFGGGDADQLEKRGELGKVAQAAVAAGPVRTVTEFRTARVTDEVEGTVRMVGRRAGRRGGRRDHRAHRLPARSRDAE